MSHGNIAHIELPTPDLAASQHVYKTIFGSRFEAVPGLDGTARFTTPAGHGGLMSGPQAERPSATGPILQHEVDDIDAARAAIVAGGRKTLIAKTKTSDAFGDFALFLDNVGCRLGPWSAQ